MGRKTTIRDIAREAGVSDTTVSLAFKENSRISIETRRRVLRIARRLKYFPNLAARDLRYGGSPTIGFVVTDITDPFYSRMIRSAEKIARELGYSVLFAESNWDPEKEVKIVSRMIEGRVRGLIMCFCEKTDHSLRLIREANLDHIAVDTFPSFYKGPYVINNVVRAGAMAAEHLLSVGCRNPAFFTARESMEDFSSFRSLLEGFQGSLCARGLRFDPDSVVNSDLTIEGGRQGFLALRSGGKQFDGIFCVNDLCALGVIDAAEQHGLEAGRDIAVMGIDNIEIAAVSRISLTSIDQPYDQIIELATRALIDSMERGVVCAVRRKLDPRLIVRSTTKLA